jgi:hypothetical protein
LRLVIFSLRPELPRCRRNVSDAVFLKFNGQLHYLWRRAVDQEGDVLDILVQSRRDKKAAKKFFRKLLKGLRYVPRVIIHRQAEELPRSQARDHAQCRASPEQVAEQPSGEFTSADQIAREDYEAVQVSASRPALPLGLRDHHVILSSEETSVQSSWLSRSDEDKIRRLGRSDRGPVSCLNKRGHRSTI